MSTFDPAPGLLRMGATRERDTALTACRIIISWEVSRPGFLPNLGQCYDVRGRGTYETLKLEMAKIEDKNLVFYIV